jgi:hypothetical protein
MPKPIIVTSSVARASIFQTYLSKNVVGIMEFKRFLIWSGVQHILSMHVVMVSIPGTPSKIVI